MQPSVIELYDRIREAPDENVRARIIAEAFEQVERRYPAMTDLATNAALRESELRLLKEIEQLRGEVKRDIEQLRGEFRVQIEQLRSEIYRTRLDVIKWTAGLLLAQMALIVTAVRFLVGGG